MARRLGSPFTVQLVLALLAAGALDARAQSPDWRDEFDGPAGTSPDPAKWNIEVVANPANNEAQYYSNRTRNVALNGKGQLELVANKEAMGGKQYTSGRINTSGKFSQQYGRFEARMQLAAGQGLWPAFWMLGVNNGCGGWPGCGEIDIMENRGRTPRTSSSALHGPGYSGNTPINKEYTLPAGAPGFAEAFHVFAAEWTAGQIRFYVDGALHYTVNKADVERYGRWAYDRPFYLILNLAVGGHFDGGRLPPDGALPAKVTVDYVRAWKQGTSVLGDPFPGRALRAPRGGSRLLVGPARLLDAGAWSAPGTVVLDARGRTLGAHAAPASPGFPVP
jgi:beta-glucanase (GH16 family)